MVEVLLFMVGVVLGAVFGFMCTSILTTGELLNNNEERNCGMTEKTLRYIVKRMEVKLKELMGEEAFMAFSAGIAKDAFRHEIEGMEDGDFKNFVIENFGEIVGDKR